MRGIKKREYTPAYNAMTDKFSRTLLHIFSDKERKKEKKKKERKRKKKKKEEKNGQETYLHIQ